ncbi:hypothetical protein [Lysobacter sp. TAF61]|uniref:hypothetical protein n=1 Tax=Lysobacter sp. TAF61 TaxID=3233072 RepID=UPI003F960937
MFERLVGEDRLARIPVLARQAITFLLVVVGWVFFRSDSFEQAGRIFSGMVGRNGLMEQFNPALMQRHVPAVLMALVGWWFWIKLEPRVVGTGPMHERQFSLSSQWILFAVFVLALVISASSNEIPFLYFQF